MNAASEKTRPTGELSDFQILECEFGRRTAELDIARRRVAQLETELSGLRNGGEALIERLRRALVENFQVPLELDRDGDVVAVHELGAADVIETVEERLRTHPVRYPVVQS